MGSDDRIEGKHRADLCPDHSGFEQAGQSLEPLSRHLHEKELCRDISGDLLIIGYRRSSRHKPAAGPQDSLGAAADVSPNRIQDGIDVRYMVLEPLPFVGNHNVRSERTNEVHIFLRGGGRDMQAGVLSQLYRKRPYVPRAAVNQNALARLGLSVVK